MKVRLAGLLVIAVILPGAVACGGSGSSGTPEEQVTTTFNSFRTALLDGNGEQACSKLSSQGLQELTTQMKNLGTAQSGTDACKSIVQLLGTFVKIGKGTEPPTALCDTSFGALIEAASKKSGKATTCKSLLSGTYGQQMAKQIKAQFSTQLTKLEQAKLTNVTVSGDTAKATLPGSDKPARFVKVDGSWKLASQGG